MKKIFLFFFILIGLSLFSQGNLKNIEKDNILSVYYPFHIFFDDTYGNLFLRNGAALGIEYSYTFRKNKLGIFTNAQFTYYGKPLKIINYDIDSDKTYYTLSRGLGLFSLGVQKNILNLKSFNLIPKVFMNYRTGNKKSVLNKEFGLFESTRFSYYNDFGFGAGLNMAYGFTDVFSASIEIEKMLNAFSDISA